MSSLIDVPLPVSSIPTAAPSGPRLTSTVAPGPPPRPPDVNLSLVRGPPPEQPDELWAARAEALSIASSRASASDSARASTLGAPRPVLRISFGSDFGRLPRLLRKSEKSFLKTNCAKSLRGSPARGFGNTCLSGRQVTRLPTLTRTVPLLHLFALRLAASSATGPEKSWRASATVGAARAASTTSAARERGRTLTCR